MSRAIPISTLLLALILIAGLADVVVGAEPCAANAQKLVVCGSGANALIVLDETTSPSGKIAIGWRAKGAITAEFPEPDEVENHLVRLADGQALGLVVGHSWANGKGRANHVYRTVAWSPDSRWLIVGDGGKWALEAVALYSIDERAGKVVGHGLFREIKSAAVPVLRAQVGAGRAGAYLLDIAGDKKIEITNSGTATIPLLFQIPKQDGDIGLAVRFNATRQGDRIAISPLKASLIKN
jgi:hypothetical protein